MCIWSILPTNFQKNQRGGGWNPPPLVLAVPKKSVVLRGLTELNRNKVTIGSVINTWKNLTCDLVKLLRVSLLSFPSAISDSFIPPYGYTSITLDFRFFVVLL